MKTYKYNKVVVRACSFLLPLTAYLFMSCSSFLEEQVPQATLTQDEVKDPKYIDDVLTSAYAGLVATRRSRCGTTTRALTTPTWAVPRSLTVNRSTGWRKARA